MDMVCDNTELLPSMLHSNKKETKETKENPCLLYIVVFQTVVLVVILCILSSLAPDIARTLKDVQVVMPEMKLSVERLTRMVPEVNKGISILRRICVKFNFGNCQ